MSIWEDEDLTQVEYATPASVHIIYQGTITGEESFVGSRSSYSVIFLESPRVSAQTFSSWPLTSSTGRSSTPHSKLVVVLT